jgi:hypothetical protein
MQLNPHYPPVFRTPAFLNAYAQGRYAEALDLAVRFNIPAFFTPTRCARQRSANLASARPGSERFRKCWLSSPISPPGRTATTRNGWDAKTVDHLLDGLRKAGLEIPED